MRHADDPNCGMPYNFENDIVNHPSHYADKQIEVIDYIKDTLTPEQYQGYLLGNALKYISRAGKKDPAKYTEDLRKCVWYLEREIKRYEEFGG